MHSACLAPCSPGTLCMQNSGVIAEIVTVPIEPCSLSIKNYRRLLFCISGLSTTCGIHYRSVALASRGGVYIFYPPTTAFGLFLRTSNSAMPLRIVLRDMPIASLTAFGPPQPGLGFRRGPLPAHPFVHQRCRRAVSRFDLPNCGCDMIPAFRHIGHPD